MFSVRLTFKRPGMATYQDPPGFVPHHDAVELHEGFESRDLARVFGEVRAARLEQQNCILVKSFVES